MFASPKRLRAAGVVGINRRNCRYVADTNPRRLMPLVNDKLATKRLAKAAGIPVPELYGVVEVQAHVRRFERVLDGRETFVVKPAMGAQGDGILVVDGRMRRGWRRAGGVRMTDSELHFHLSNVLSGMYSLNGLSDVAMLEEKVAFDPVFEPISHRGVPDIRILVYRGVPCMAMIRLPTRESDGKANLHKGGIGVGVDIATGRTTRAVHNDRLTEEHPDTGNAVTGFDIPGWATMLDMAARCHDQTGLGYLGVDIVIDRHRGPLLLELNARPGLAVQLANGRGLQPSVDAVDRAGLDRAAAAERVGFARERCGDP
jgi:alpha-L-glutamate ligase-like protein